MTVEGVVTVALDVAYIAIFLVTLRAYLRRRDRVRLALVAVFCSLALVLGISALRSVAPGIAAAPSIVSLPAFLARPILAVWLVHHFRPVPRWFLGLGVVSFLALIGIVVVVSMAGPSALSLGSIAVIL